MTVRDYRQSRHQQPVRAASSRILCWMICRAANSRKAALHEAARIDSRSWGDKAGGNCSRDVFSLHHPTFPLGFVGKILVTKTGLI